MVKVVFFKCGVYEPTKNSLYTTYIIYVVISSSFFFCGEVGGGVGENTSTQKNTVKKINNKKGLKKQRLVIC